MDREVVSGGGLRRLWVGGRQPALTMSPNYGARLAEKSQILTTNKLVAYSDYNRQRRRGRLLAGGGREEEYGRLDITE